MFHLIESLRYERSCYAYSGHSPKLHFGGSQKYMDRGAGIYRRDLLHFSQDDGKGISRDGCKVTDPLYNSYP